MATDEYGTKYMEGGEAVFTERLVARRLLRTLGVAAGLTGLVALGGALASGAGVLAALLAGVGGVVALGVPLGLVALLMVVSRVTVTRTHLRSEIGPFGPSIPLASIRAVSLAPRPKLMTQEGNVSPRRRTCCASSTR